MSYERISLDNLLNGAALEKFKYELTKVSENIADPNTTSGVREVNIKIKLKPNEERTHVSCSVLISSKFPGNKESTGILHFVEDKGFFYFVQDTGDINPDLFKDEKSDNEFIVKDIINKRKVK